MWSNGRLQVLDHCEFENANWIYPFAGESVGDYLARLISGEFFNLSPHFTAQLVTALKEIKPINWIPARELPSLNDRGPVASRCESGVQKVQIAYRTKLPSGQFVVYYDPEMVRRIYQTNSQQVATLNVAILILHEALYLMGVEMSHTTSSPSRRVLAKLLAYDIYAVASPGERLIEFQNFLQRERFENFIYLFVPAVRSVAPSAGPNKASRARAHLELNRKHDEILKRHGLNKIDKYPPEVLKPADDELAYWVVNRASPEETFVYFLKSDVYRPSKRFPSHEIFWTEGVPDEQPLRQYCKYLELQRTFVVSGAAPANDRAAAMQLFDKAIRYCAMVTGNSAR